ncbi:hypothetical protein ACJJTC_019010 [Scirpophaga incertulas]
MAYPSTPPPAPPNVGSTNVIFITEMRFDPSYLKTPEGIIKIIIMVLSLLGFICIQSSVFWWNSRGVYFNIVAQLAFWMNGLVLLMYLFHAVEKYHNIKWLKIELVMALTFVVLYLIGSTIVVAFGLASYSAAGLFGYLCMVTCGAEAWVKVRALQNGALAQGRLQGAKDPHVVCPPALP